MADKMAAVQGYGCISSIYISLNWYSLLHFAVCQLLCWAFLFSLVFMFSLFSGLRIEASFHPQYRVSVYTLFLKRRTSRFNFRSYVLNLVKINMFFLSKVGSPRGRFIGQLCLDQLTVWQIY